MSAKKVIVIGCGNRGKTYTDIMSNEFAGEFEVVAVAEPIEDRREYMRKKHCIPAEMCFESWEPLLEMEKFADVALIATMDRDHYAPAMAAIEKGYDLMLEKPMSPSPEECRAIQHAAEQKGVFVLVCHVLRFTKFFKALKNMIDDEQPKFGIWQGEFWGKPARFKKSFALRVLLITNTAAFCIIAPIKEIMSAISRISTPRESG